jgi:Tol biopolymer transport system component
VAFQSDAANLVTGDTNGMWDVFMHDRETGTTTRASVGIRGAQGSASSLYAAISADGRWVAFESSASTLVTGDTNDTWDVFMHHRETRTTTRVSVGPGGVQGDDRSGWAAISADGRRVAFYSSASNLVAGDTNGMWDVFVHDRETGTTTRVSVGPAGAEGNDHSNRPAISADGRSVAFWSSAGNLVTGDTNGVPDAFVHEVGPLR